MKNLVHPSVTSSLKDYDNEKIKRFIEILQSRGNQLMVLKDKKYGGSWQKDGKIGAFLNLKRKMDRVLEGYKTGEIFEVEGSETTIDSVVDMLKYGEMYLSLLYFKAEEIGDDKTIAKFNEYFNRIENNEI